MHPLKSVAFPQYCTCKQVLYSLYMQLIIEMRAGICEAVVELLHSMYKILGSNSTVSKNMRVYINLGLERWLNT